MLIPYWIYANTNVNSNLFICHRQEREVIKADITKVENKAHELTKQMEVSKDIYIYIYISAPLGIVRRPPLTYIWHLALMFPAITTTIIIIIIIVVIVIIIIIIIIITIIITIIMMIMIFIIMMMIIIIITIIMKYYYYY